MISLTRLAIQDDCATAADVRARQDRVRQLRRAQTAPTPQPQPQPQPPAPPRAPIALKPWRAPPPPKPCDDTKMRLIREEISRQSGFTLRDIDGYVRTPYLVLVRHLSYALCVRLAENTYAEISRIHGNHNERHIPKVVRRMTPLLDKTGLAFNSRVAEWVAAALPLLHGELLALEAEWQARGFRKAAKNRERDKRERERTNP
jgi:hypothetical protein